MSIIYEIRVFIGYRSGPSDVITPEIPGFENQTIRSRTTQEWIAELERALHERDQGARQDEALGEAIEIARQHEQDRWGR